MLTKRTRVRIFSGRKAFGQTRQAFLWFALASIFFQATFSYVLAADCPILNSISAEAKADHHENVAMPEHCPMAMANAKLSSHSADKHQRAPTTSSACGLCATIALFHSAVGAGLLFLPPPQTRFSVNLISAVPTVVYLTTVTAFSARAPPSSI